MGSSSSSKKCKVCKKSLGETQAKYCPDGHPQSLSTPYIKHEDRHSDDNDDSSNSSSDDLQIISVKKFEKPATNVSNLLPIKEMKSLREKAGIKDASKKVKESQKGQFGIRPDNAPSKTVIALWFAEPPPVKATYAGISAKIYLEPATKIDSPEDVDRFIRQTIEAIPTVQAHAAIANGELLVDKSRLSWVGSPEGNTMAWTDISDDFNTIGELLATLSAKDSLYFCIPVQRILKDIVIRKSRERNMSVSDVPAAKRPKSKVGSKKASQKNTDKGKSVKQAVDIKKEKRFVKQEVKGEIEEEETSIDKNIETREGSNSKNIELDEFEWDLEESEQDNNTSDKEELVPDLLTRKSGSGRSLKKPARYE